MAEKNVYRIARVCLTDGTVSCYEPEPSMVQAYLGGRGLGLRLMQKHPVANPLLFMTGPMTDAAAPSGGRFCAVTRSPVTGLPIAPTSGSSWGVALKRAGWDGVWLEGTSPEWVSLCIEQSTIQLRSAAEAVRMSTVETAQWQKEQYGRECSVLSIGPAGENQVPLSAIFCGTQRAFGRDGIGGVMGAKKLKALVICSNETIVHSCARCAVHCGHAEADTAFNLCNDYGLDAIGFSRVIAAARELRCRGNTAIPDWDAAQWATQISAPSSELTRLAGMGAEALCKAYGAPEIFDALRAVRKTARSSLPNKLTKEMSAVLDAMGCCLFSAAHFQPRDYADWLSAATGTDYTEAALNQIGRNIGSLEDALHEAESSAKI